MPFEPDKITREHVSKAIEKIESENIVLEPSTKYDVMFNGKAYPPKELMRYAHEFMNGEKIWENSGGNPTNKYFKKMGLTIVNKNGLSDEKIYYDLNKVKFEDLIKQYLDYCTRSRWLDYDESDKFKFAKWLHDNVNLESQSDEEILKICLESQEQFFDPEQQEKGIRFIKSQLQYNDAIITMGDIGIIRELSRNLPADESEFLKLKSLSFPKLSIWLGTLLPEQFFVLANEELISGLAHLFDLEKFSKSGYRGFLLVQNLLKTLYKEIFPAHAAEFDILLPKIGKAKITDTLASYDKIWFVQDFILFVHRRILNPTPRYYWVCQGSNFKEEFDSKIIKAPVDTIHHHKRLKVLKEGDVIVHYANQALMAVSKVVGEFQVVAEPPLGKDNEPWLVVKVEFQTIEMPIELDKVREILLRYQDVLPRNYSPLTKNWTVNQGYLFQFSKEAYQLLFEGVNPDEKKFFTVGSFWNTSTPQDQANRFLENGIWENGWDGKFVDDVNAVPEGSLIALKTTFKREDKMEIKAIGTVTRNLGDGRNLQVEWKENFKPFKVNYSGGYWDTIKQVENPDHIKDIFFHDYSIDLTQISMNKHSLNTILYGPPGTGKTYHSIDKAVLIATGSSSDHSGNKKVFDRLRAEGQIEFVTFHQNYSYEDFMVGLRPDPDSAALRFSPYKGVFYQLCKRARDNYEASKSQTSLRSYEDLVQDMAIKITDDQPLEFRTLRGKPFWITDDSEKTLYLKKSTGNEMHTLSIGTLIDIAEGKRDMFAGLSVYYQPIIEYLNENRKSTGIRQEQKSYVLVIDEINRANISKVFGELITLLENDKRLDQENELRVTLPNGEINFTVPPNLFVIGTMNTADKSIALIDIALRRRFEFEGKYPKSETISDPQKSQLLVQLNKAVFAKKNSADYLIGHAYFMNDTPTEEILRNKVIPLLTEYFSGKPNLIAECFNETNWNVTYNTESYAWDIMPRTS